MDAGPKTVIAVTNSNQSSTDQNPAQSQPQSQQQQQTNQTNQQDFDNIPDSEIGPVDDGILLARVNVPELYISKCLQFPKDQLVWDVKQQCLASLPKELKESFNYGLFCPPVNGKAGKFLDEERRLGDYPFNGPVGYLELKYKRRVYKMLNLDEKQLKALHTRTNLKRLLDYVANSQVEKISKLCSKGLDPNFHCQESGETPLTLATTLKKSSKVIIALVNGGALLDYRTKDGSTAIHKAVERNNLEAVKTLLELGASPNYRDAKGLTPLYYSVTYKTDPMLCETLLHDHATIGSQDLQGWQEVHQACRNNLVQHLDHLLFYGADMNARNASGNTPLHICAVNNTDSSCIRQLLFRGAQKDSLNYANQTPYQVAVIAGNMELADVIQNYQQDEVVPFKGPPRYNPKRRSVAFCGLNSSFPSSNVGTLTRIPSNMDSNNHNNNQQNSGSLTPCSPISSSCTSPIPSLYRPLSPPSLNNGGNSTLTRPVLSNNEHNLLPASRVVSSAESYLASLNGTISTPSTPGPIINGANNTIQRLPSVDLHQHHQHHIRTGSDYQSSAVRSIGGNEAYPNLRLDGLTRHPDPQQQHRLELQHRLDVHVRTMDIPPSPSPSSRSLAPFSSASSSLSEGSNQPSGEDSASIVTDKSLGDTASDVISDSSGVGTSTQSDTTNPLAIPGTTVVCVEAYNSGIPGHLVINQGEILEVTGATDCGLLEGILRGQGTGLFPAHCVQEVRLRHTNIQIGQQQQQQQQQQTRNRVLGRRESQHNFQPYNPRVTSEPRTVVLHRSKKGFGFVLRGAKTTNNAILEMTPSPRYPALQYLDDVDEGGVADLAGLRKGDFLIQINGEDVTTALHEHVVDLIRKSGELVRMTVISPVLGLPSSQSTGLLPTSQPIQRQYATLPRKGSTNVTIGGTLGRSPAPMPPRRDPKTTLSVGRARARSMVAGLESGNAEKEVGDENTPGGISNSEESVNNQQSASGQNNNNSSSQPRVASIRARPTSSRITAVELEELFQRQQGFPTLDLHYETSKARCQTMSSTKSHPSSPAKTGRVYASVAEMKRKGKSKVRFFGGLGGGSDLHRDFHSTPDLNIQAQSSNIIAPKGHRSQEDVNANRNGLPPPNHPPPPPPVGQVVKVNVSSNGTEPVKPGTVYDNIAHIQQVKELAAATADNYGVMSSFRPANNAKLYASPEDMKNVGYRSLSLPNQSARAHLRKSHSLRSSSVGNGSSFQLTNGNLQNGQDHVDNNQITNGDDQKQTQQQQNNQQNSNNQYAQPLKNTRAQSVGGIARDSKKKQQNVQIVTVNGQSEGTTSAPPIPDPDYSLSESDNDGEISDEGDVSEITKELEKAAVRDKLEAAKETSGNSNISAGSASSSSSGSGSLPHSFSVDEIQTVKKQLKVRFDTQNTLIEDGDNSSSGVSSDQEVPGGPVLNFDETSRKNETNQQHHHHMQMHQHIHRQQQQFQHQQYQHHQQQLHQQMHHQPHHEKDHCSILKRPAHIGSGGHLTRHAVSLAQLPPPLEADAEEQSSDLYVPPPPEFNADGTAIVSTGANGASEIVFAPPPQFSDNKQHQSKVKIIGAIPKSVTINTGPAKLKQQPGRLHSQ